MSQYKKQYSAFLDSPAGIEFLTYIHNQLDTEHRQAEQADDANVAFGHAKTAKAYRDVDDWLESVKLGTLKV